jgi:hypothetical protein
MDRQVLKQHCQTANKLRAKKCGEFDARFGSPSICMDDDDHFLPISFDEFSSHLPRNVEEFLQECQPICSISEIPCHRPPPSVSPNFTDLMKRLIPGLQRIPAQPPFDVPAQPEKTHSQGRRSFSQKELEAIENWWQAHADHPYITRNQLDRLMSLTSLSEGQIRTWLTNKRQRTHFQKV